MVSRCPKYCVIILEMRSSKSPSVHNFMHPMQNAFRCDLFVVFIIGVNSFHSPVNEERGKYYSSFSTTMTLFCY